MIVRHFPFAEVIHPTLQVCHTRCCLDSMIMAQVCLRLATINGHSECKCSVVSQHNATDVASLGVNVINVNSRYVDTLCNCFIWVRINFNLNPVFYVVYFCITDFQSLIVNTTFSESL